MKGSDVDISINTNCYLNERKFLELVNIGIRDFIKSTNAKNITTKFIERANVPLIQYQNTNPINNKEIKIDICVNNVLGCINSQMLKTLS